MLKTAQPQDGDKRQMSKKRILLMCFAVWCCFEVYLIGGKIGVWDLLSCTGKFSKGDEQGALVKCSRALNIQEKNFIARTIRGSIYLKQQNYTAAEEDFDLAVQTQPFSLAESYLGRAFSRFFQKDYEGALPDFERLSELSPQMPEAYYGSGICKMMLGDDIDNVKTDLRKALDLYKLKGKGNSKNRKLVAQVLQRINSTHGNSKIIDHS